MSWGWNEVEEEGEKMGSGGGGEGGGREKRRRGEEEGGGGGFPNIYKGSVLNDLEVAHMPRFPPPPHSASGLKM